MLPKNSWKTEIKLFLQCVIYMETRVSLNFFVNDCRLIKKISLYKINYFLELYGVSKNKTKVELDISNYETKFDLKGTTGIDSSKFTKKIWLS